ncbi:MAG: hypothetical protein ABWZ76_06415 [Acidimicrobiales bacterium]
MSEPATDPGPSAAARWLVTVTLVLLLVPGLVGFEAWPLTAWRLFSLAREDRQTQWLLEVVTGDGDARTVSLEELPLRYRHAAWPMAALPGASEGRREAVCQALLEPAADVVPGLSELRIVRDRQRLVEAEGEWVVTHDPEVVHRCQRAPSR